MSAPPEVATVPAPAPAAARQRIRMRPASALTLLAVALVVLLVSLPRLRELALRENQGDARQLVTRVAELLEGNDARFAPTIQSLLESRPALRRQLDDAEFLDDGSLMRRHGYLFEVVAFPQAQAVRAWPARHGQSGLAAYAWSQGTGLIGHPNVDGRWSAELPPLAPGDPAFDPAGWMRLARRD